MSRIIAYLIPSNGLSLLTVPKMVEGARACGHHVDVVNDVKFKPEHAQEYDGAIFWGYIETMQNAMRWFNEAGKPVVYLDLAYWERGTHYKVSVGARHPEAYFQKFKHDDSRRIKFGITKIRPFRADGVPIVIAAMSRKASWAEKEDPWASWEMRAVDAIRKVAADRPIVFRSKGVEGANPIPGTILSSSAEPLGPLLASAWAVVTRHSNVAVDGLVSGVPAFAWFGVAKPMALQDLSKIEKPYYPEDRYQWLNDVAYCQWSLDEMKDGTCWRHLQSEGLVP